MSGPREEDGFGDGPGRDGSGWHEPAHLGEGGAGREEPAPAAWEPPGWSLPPARPGRPAGGPAAPIPASAPFADPFGLRAEAVQRGWTVTDGDAPADAVLRDLLAAGPVRLGKEHRPAGVARGR